MNDRINEYELNYKYYENGLLKSVRGYVPRYFKYEQLLLPHKHESSALLLNNQQYQSV